MCIGGFGELLVDNWEMVNYSINSIVKTGKIFGEK